MLLAHLLSCNSAGQAPVSQDLDWRQVSILKQVEVPLLQYAADNSISGSVTGAGPADALAGAVARLLPQSSYTLEQVCRKPARSIIAPQHAKLLMVLQLAAFS